MDSDAVLTGIRTITDSLADNTTAAMAIKAIEHLQLNPNAKADAISSIVEKSEGTRAEAYRQLAELTTLLAQSQDKNNQKTKR